MTGEVFPTGSREALTKRIIRCAEDAAHRVRLAENARRHVERFDIRAATAGTVRALSAVARKRVPAVDPAGTYERRPLA
jgi:hypothetical protein